jgi:hypothetical protein
MQIEEKGELVVIPQITRNVEIALSSGLLVDDRFFDHLSPGSTAQPAPADMPTAEA